MTNFFSLKSAALLILFSAVLHLVTPILAGGFNDDAKFMVSGGVLYLIIAFVLSHQWRWFAYFAFLTMLAGTIISFGFSLSGTTIPTWLYAINALVSLLAAFSLFGALWRSKPVLA